MIFDIILQAKKLAEPEPAKAKFRSKGAEVGVIKGKWPAPKPESELRSFKNLAQEPEPLKFSRLHQPRYHQVR